MFTPELLFEMALDAQSELDQNPRERDRANIERRRDEAFNAALWMEQNDITEAAMIGPFGNLELQPGDQVHVAAGVAIGAPDGPLVSPGLDVTVCAIDGGLVIDIGGTISLRNQRISWFDETGYCHWTEASNVRVRAMDDK